MSISVYFQLRCNRTTNYIIKEELLFFSISCPVEKTEPSSVIFFLFE